MTNTSTILLVPFILAFFIFVLRFYSRERAASVTNLSFLLAMLTVLVAGAYLILGVIDALPPYSTICLTAIGLVLLVTAISRMFMI